MDATTASPRDLAAHERLPLALAAVLLAVCAASAWFAPAGLVSWALEVVPGLAVVAALAALHRRLPVSHLVHVAVSLHVLVLNYGGIHTYAETPLGNWARDAFDLSRNPYDRIGHLAQGFFPALLAREVLLRRTPLRRGGWLAFLVVCVMLAVSAFWELLEWWTALVAAPEVGTAFLGAQGDVWDAQWDMLLALLGAIASLALLGRVHDRSMARVPGPAA